jgi:rhodanese-related sulfurtransferase
MIEIKSKTISPCELAGILGSGHPVQLLDVRTPREYASAHVPGAKLIPLNELHVDEVLARHKRETSIYVLCQAGARAQRAIAQFELAGCEDCILVEGGMQAWINAGLPVHRGAREVLPLMRQVQIVVGALSAAGAFAALVVNRWFATLPLLIGCGLLFAGVTGACGMALLLARMPWNRGQNSSSHCCHPE